MLHSSNPLRIPCLALCLAFPMAALFPAHAANDPAFSAQPVAANQVVFDRATPVRAKDIKGLTFSGNRIYTNSHIPEDRMVSIQGGTSEVTIENNTAQAMGEFKLDD